MGQVMAAPGLESGNHDSMQGYLPGSPGSYVGGPMLAGRRRSARALTTVGMTGREELVKDFE